MSASLPFAAKGAIICVNLRHLWTNHLWTNHLWIKTLLGSLHYDLYSKWHRHDRFLLRCIIVIQSAAWNNPMQICVIPFLAGWKLRIHLWIKHLSLFRFIEYLSNKFVIHIFHFIFIVHIEQNQSVVNYFEIENNTSTSTFAFSLAFYGDSGFAAICNNLITNIRIFFKFIQKMGIIFFQRFIFF